MRALARQDFGVGVGVESKLQSEMQRCASKQTSGDHDQQKW
jgi:hypothetical protein